jgi:transposase
VAVSGEVGSARPLRRLSATFDTMLPDATQVADPFHVVRVANDHLDDCRRRMQNETLGRRRQARPAVPDAARVDQADERLDGKGRERLVGLLDAGDPRDEVRTAWDAKEVVRSIYQIGDPDLAADFVARLAPDLGDDFCLLETHRTG